MQIEIFTIAYVPKLHKFDQSQLSLFCKKNRIIESRSQFFIIDGLPVCILVVHYVPQESGNSDEVAMGHLSTMQAFPNITQLGEISNIASVPSSMATPIAPSSMATPIAPSSTATPNPISIPASPNVNQDSPNDTISFTPYSSPENAARAKRAQEREEYLRENLTPEVMPIFRALQTWRVKKAQEINVPAYFYGTNRNFVNIIHGKPKNLQELKRVSGLSASKMAKFGQELLNIFHQALASLSPQENSQVQENSPNSHTQEHPLNSQANSNPTTPNSTSSGAAKSDET